MIMVTKHKERSPRRTRRDAWRPPEPLARFIGVVLFLAVPVLGLLLFPLVEREEVDVPIVGAISTREIIAPYDFPVHKDPAILQSEREEAAGAVPPVLVMDVAYEEEVDRKLTRLARELARPVPDQLPVEEFRDSVARQMGIQLSAASVETLRSDSLHAVIDSVHVAVVTLLRRGVMATEVAQVVSGKDVVELRRQSGDVYRPANSLTTVESALDHLRAEGRRVFRTELAARQAFLELAEPLLAPNTAYNLEETAARQEAARDEVPVITHTVHKGERILDSHQRVTAEHVRAMQSLKAFEREKLMSGSGGAFWSNVGRFAAMCLVLLTFLIYLRSQHPHTYHDTRALALLTTLGALAVVVLYLVVVRFERTEILAPLAALPLLVALLVNRGVALFSALMVPSLVMILLLPDGLSPQFLIATSVAGVAAVLATENVKRRHELYLPVILIALSYVLVAVAMGMTLTAPAADVLRMAVQGLMSAVMAGAITIVLLPVLEKLFHITTNFTLLELLDRNHPLLQRMAIEAPGTFHHSMLVAELAREAVAVVGGNSLLAQVGAYYHDIGKMEKPEYFIENQTGKNVHDKLAPTMSCLVLGSHVREGMLMAQDAGLPREIIAFIPEHHGTTLMSYFYHKASEADDSVDESDFRYPGPRPHRKETAIVMLADSVEATARSIPDPTPGNLRTVVTRLVEGRMRDGQLDESDLTLADLAKVREAFGVVLNRFFHSRIQYPGQEHDQRSQRAVDPNKTGELKVAPQGEVPPRVEKRARVGRPAADGTEALRIDRTPGGRSAHSPGRSPDPDARVEDRA